MRHKKNLALIISVLYAITVFILGHKINTAIFCLKIACFEQRILCNFDFVDSSQSVSIMHYEL